MLRSAAPILIGGICGVGLHLQHPWGLQSLEDCPSRLQFSKKVSDVYGSNRMCVETFFRASTSIEKVCYAMFTEYPQQGVCNSISNSWF